MNLTEFAVRRPITVMMATLIILLLGVISFFRIPIDLMPDVTLPALTVSTSYTNVGAEEIENSITRPIEEIVATIADVEEISSESSEGRSRVRINFKWGKDLEDAAADVREKLDRIRNRLPEDSDSPVLFKFDLSAFPIMLLGVESQMEINLLQEFVEDKIKYRIERLPGVASTEIRGGRSREIQLFIDMAKADSLNIPLAKVVSALQINNINQPAGYVNEGRLEVVLRSLGQFKDVKDIEERVVGVKNGVPVLFRDIAVVKMSLSKVSNITHVNNKPGIRLSVQKQSGANTVAVAEKVNNEIKKINADYPYLKIFPINDSSKYIQDSINSVKSSAIYGSILAVLILFFFLRNIRATFIIALTIPISVIATFILIYGANLTLNIISFGGLALGVGMLVDNSIVVLENSFRHISEEKLNKIDGALKGTKEVAGAIVASTLTSVVVFLPMIFLTGIAGLMFKQIAYVVGFSLLCSLIVALTIIPLATSRYLEVEDSAGKKKLSPFIEKISRLNGRALDFLDEKYTHYLNIALKKKRKLLITLSSIFVLSLVLIKGLGFEFMPASDEGEVRISIESAVGTRLEIMENYVKAIEGIILSEVPERDTTTASIGGGGGGFGGSRHTGDIRLKLVGIKDRKRSSEEISRALSGKLSGIPGIKCRVRTGTGLFILRRLAGSGEKISIQIRGDSLEEGRKLAEALAKDVEKIEGIADVKVSREEGRPEKVLRINYQKAARMGLSVTDINDMVYIGMGGKVATYLRTGGREYDILIQFKDAQDMSETRLMSLPIYLPSGGKTVLGAVAEIKPGTGPVSIERLNQERVIYVSADFSGRALGDVVDDINALLRRSVIPMEFTVSIGGEYEDQKKSFREMIFVLILAIVLVYMVMAAQFESLLDPFIIIFSMPFSLIGVVLMLLLTGTTFNVQAFIGLIMLAGIVVNNAIVLVDYTNMLRKEYKYELKEAIITAGRKRLRPILMTTLTTVLGLLPLAIGLGEGSEMQIPLARTVFGGLLSSTLITLFLIPVLYEIFEKRIRKKPAVTV